MIEVEQINKLSLEELNTLKSQIVRELDLRVRSLGNQIRVGQLVKVNHNKTYGKQFKVIKVNNKSLKLEEVGNSYKKYNVSYSLVELIKS